MDINIVQMDIKIVQMDKKIVQMDEKVVEMDIKIVQMDIKKVQMNITIVQMNIKNSSNEHNFITWAIRDFAKKTGQNNSKNYFFLSAVDHEDDLWPKLFEYVCNTIPDNFYFNDFIFPP